MERNICKKCGYENFDNVEVCFGCKTQLVEAEKSSHITSGNNVISENEVDMKNDIAQLIKGVSYSILIFGIIGSIITEAKFGPYLEWFSFGGFVYSLFLTLIMFSLLRGLAEIIDILHQSKNYQKTIVSLLNKK